MSEVAGAGRTVLFVSHNMAVMANLCDRGVLLERGRVRAEGTIQEAIAVYSQEFNDSVYVGEARPDAPSICRVELDSQALQAGDLRVEVFFESPFPVNPVVGIVVHSRQGTPLFGTNPLLHGEGYRGAELRSGVATVMVRDLPLYSGQYRVSVWLCDRQNTMVYDKKPDALAFDFVSPYALPSGISPDVNGPMRTAAVWTLAPRTVEGT